MIYLEQNTELYNNDIRAMLQAFFDNEKVSLVEADTRLSLQVLYTDDLDVETGVKQGGYVTFTLADHSGYRDSRTVVVNYYDKALARNPLKAGLYRLLSSYTGRTLPWGSLTGVRPAKIATAFLEQGCEDAQIIRHYTQTCLADRQKAELCIEVAKREQELLAGFDFRRDYCLYIGIPFCPSRCLYCSFTSYPIASYRDRVDTYLQALYREMELVAEACRSKRLVAVYIGGGTPSSLSAQQLNALVCKVRETFPAADLKEFCVECGRPDSITEEKLAALKAAGVGRISINPQTMRDHTLSLIGRAHTARQTVEAFHMARKAGFDNINMDMITGLPGENIDDIRYTLSCVKELGPDSLTVHSLAIKRAANLKLELAQYGSLLQGSTNEMLQAVDGCARELSLFPYYLYRQKNIPGKLENVGYAARGRECFYNVLIMEEKVDIMAIGAGASSKFVFHDENRIERVENVKNVDAYMERIEEMLDRKQNMFREAGYDRIKQGRCG